MSWTVTRITPTLGARVEGVDLSATDPAELDALGDLLAEHHVLALPGQSLTPDRHIELGTHYGEPLIHPFLDAIPEHPAILEVLKEPDDRVTFGGEYWHADISFLDPPSSVSLLYSHEVPDVGGDTLFADQFAAYDALSEPMRRFLDGLTARHVYPDMEDTPATGATHPVVRFHPRTGRRSLFVNPAFVVRIEELDPAESSAVLSFLYSHQIRPEFQARISWTPGQLVMWDNRSVQHYAMNDYPGVRRRLQRVTVMERDRY